MKRLILICGTLLGCSAGATPEHGAVVSKAGGLPDAPPMAAELQTQLDAAYVAKGEGYEPRTHHFDDEGKARFTNRLILETSPYLLQHAHNPVNWYPWGEEAFADARRLGRPILLSIGYSTCHWCHVMEKESFEDLEIAAYMNANYIPVKVDREERPDIDAIYMSAVQALTGRGGWPMTTWLDPEGRPFFGGTYFPARDGDRGSRKGFLTVLRELRELYDEQPDSVAAQAKQLTDRVRASMGVRRSGGLPDVGSLKDAMQIYKSNFDPVDGGMRQRPKFPSSLPIRLLLAEHRRTGDPELLDMAGLTLTKMAGGGMYDQIGGGFHRYSTDARWLVPHFEKMLYDNALLAVAYLEAFQATGDDAFARVARQILDYVGREMTDPAGGFYSATDADSLTPHGEMEEGWFFTWTPAEVEQVLGVDEGRRFQAYYDVTPGGNFEGRSILNVPRPAEEVARLLGIETSRLLSGLEKSRGRLYEARSQRPPPLRDEKVLTSWNGLMIRAMARGGFILDEPAYVDRAARAAGFLLEHSRRDGRLLRSHKDGRSRHNAYLDDYAFLIAGLLDLYEAAFDPRWLREAVALQEVLDRHYGHARGGYYMTSDDHETLIAREKPSYDGAEPSGNSVALFNLLRLYELTTNDAYREAAEALMRGFGPALSSNPLSLSEMLLAVEFWLSRPREVVVVTRRGPSQAEPFLAVLRETYHPGKVLAVVTEAESEAHAELVPLVRGKVARKGKATAYVCERGVCQLPTTDAETFRRQLTAAPATE